MSNLVPNPPVSATHDFTLSDLEKIEKFKDRGMLGLHSITPADVDRCMSLYLDGKSYRQIAHVLKIDRTIVLFLSHKFAWWELRKDYLDELEASIRTKVVEAKLQSQEFLMHVALALRRKIGTDVDKYFRTGDEKYIDQVDNKHLISYLKITETLHKLDSENKMNQSDKSLVSLNGLAEGVNITRTGTNSVEITPKVTPYQSKLKQFADLKREEERAKQSPPKQSRDIVSEVEKPNPESKNEKDPS